MTIGAARFEGITVPHHDDEPLARRALANVVVDPSRFAWTTNARGRACFTYLDAPP